MIRNFVRLAGTPENSKRSTMRRSGSAFRSTRRAQSPDQKGGIEIGAFDPIVGVGHSPLAERGDDRAQALAGRREASTRDRRLWRAAGVQSTPCVLELTQPRDQDGSGDQRHAAMDVIEGVHGPAISSRTMSGVQRVARISDAFAIGQN